MQRLSSIFVLVILLLGCKKNIENKEAVRQGVADHLAKRSDLMKMEVRVDAVQFSGNEADASVFLEAKSGPAAGNGMQMRYKLERQDNKWVVKGKGLSAVSGAPHGASQGAADGMPALPPGHPQ